MIVEICASNFESALAALNGGADRIELCTQLEVGGLTPSRELIQRVIQNIDLPVHVLVRPRDGDFVYSENEIKEMLETISFCTTLGVTGIVAGVLTSEGDIDVPNTKRMIEASEDMIFTFHRAFDHCNHPLVALEQLIEMGVDILLSSGQEAKAVDGLDLLLKLREQSDGRITIMPGAGINDENTPEFITAGFEAIHLSAIRKDSLKSNSILEGISDIEMIRSVMAMVH